MTNAPSTNKPRKNSRKRKPAMTAAALHAQIKLALMTMSPEQHEQVIATAARLGRYSATNRIALAVQRPNATLIMSRSAWIEAGRVPVEKGLRVFYRRKPKAQDEQADPKDTAAKGAEADTKDTDKAPHWWAPYGTTTVWDISQTVPDGCRHEDRPACGCTAPDLDPPAPTGAEGLAEALEHYLTSEQDADQQDESA